MKLTKRKPENRSDLMARSQQETSLKTASRFWE
jgi:hypothetical protein